MNEIKTKEQARQYAIDWQARTSEQSLSYLELSREQGKMEALALKFDLTEEFKENGII